MKQRRYVTNPGYDDALKIYWATDVHLLSTVDGNPDAPGAVSQYKYYYDAGRRLGEYVSVVNADNPHLAIITGDLVDSYTDDNYALFNSKWSLLNPDIKNALTLGNHDITNQASYVDVVSKLGYDGQTEIAGSKFNQVFSITNGVFGARVVVVDTNINNSGDHQSSSVGWLQTDAVEWIKSEAISATEDILLIFSHHTPYYATYFDATGIAAAKNMLEEIKASRPGMLIIWCGGHMHGGLNVETYTSLGGSCPGIRGKCMLDYNPSGFMKLFVFRDGSYHFMQQFV